MRKFFLFLLITIVVVLAAGGLYLYKNGYSLLRDSMESIIKSNLPHYLSIDHIEFDMDRKVITATGFAMKNPEQFQNKNFIHISQITCHFKMNGSTFTDGIEITDIIATKPKIYIERLPTGETNVSAIQKHVEKQKLKKDARTSISVPETIPWWKRFILKHMPAIDIYELIKLCDTLDIRDGEVSFSDGTISRDEPYTIALSGVNGFFTIDFADKYSKINQLSGELDGVLNGRPNERVRWIMRHDTANPKLTMSNRIELKNIDPTAFEPYYDKYIPITITKCSASGTLIFDFDNSILGSDNILELNGLAFKEHSANEYQKYWGDAAPSIVNYLKSSSDRLIFDFKIKGALNDLHFYLGPKVKKALVQTVAVNTISNLIAKPQNAATQAGGAAADTAQSSADAILETIKGMMK